MSNNSNDANNTNNNIIENINSSINNSSKNMINMSLPLKNSVSDQLIFFKEDILKDVKQFESQISIKCNSEFTKNSKKIIKMQEIVEEMSQKFENISSKINLDTNIEERTNKLSELYSKLEQQVLLQEIKMKNTNTKLTETIDRFNSEISESIYYPTIIGPNCKYKTFHEFIDFVISNINTLLLFKDKTYAELKEFKSKTESGMNNFQVRLDYQTKNCNAFTTASIRSSEQKMGNLLNETLTKELNKIKKSFETFTKDLEQKILSIIDNSEKIKTFEQNFERIETERKEYQRNISLYQEMNLSKQKNKHERISKNSIQGVKKASSIVKQYIEGKLKNDELFKRRRSLEGNISKLRNIKDKMDIRANHNSHKNIEILLKEGQNDENNNDNQKFFMKKIPVKSEPNNDKLIEDDSYINEDSKSDNDIESQKNKIKEEINNILFNNAKKNKTLQNSKEDKDNLILDYLKLLYQESPRTSHREKNLITPEKEKTENNINNINKSEIKLIKDDENLPVNKNLYITNQEENIHKKETNTSSFKLIKPENNTNNINTIKPTNIKTLQLSKLSSPSFQKNLNIKKKYQESDIKDIISTVKRQTKENLLPIKPPIKKPPPKIQNKLYKNKTLISLTYKPNSRNKIVFNSDNKNDNSIQNKIIPQNFSYNKINQKKNEYKRINMNFSSYQENNKEKDEQKMKKIFNEIKDVIQEDEKVIIKNRFVNYGYSKDIIFAEDKKNLINKNDENKNNISKINTNKDRPKSRIIKNE